MSNAIVLPLYFISGIFIPADQTPAWMDTLAGVFPVKPLFEALLRTLDPNTVGAGFAWGQLASWPRGGSRGRCSRSRASAGCPGTDCRGDGSRPSSGLDCPADAPARPARWTAPRTWRSPPWPTTTGASPPARCSSACPASPATATTSPPTRSPAARRRSSSRGRSGSGCPRSWSTTCAPRWPSPPPASMATRPPGCRSSGITGTNGKTTTAFLVRSLLEARGPPLRAARHGQVRRRGRGARGRAYDAGGDRPPARRSREMLAGGDDGVRDGGLLARARAAARRRDPRSPPRCSRTSRRTTSTSTPTWRPTSRPSGCCSRPVPGVRIANADDPYGRRLAEEFAGTVTFGIDADADYRAVDVRAGRAGSEFVVRSAGRRVPDGGPAAGALQRRSTRWARGRRRGRWASRPTCSARALPRRERGPGALPARRRGAAVRGPRRLRAHARLAGERAAWPRASSPAAA